MFSVHSSLPMRIKGCWLIRIARKRRERCRCGSRVFLANSRLISIGRFYCKLLPRQDLYIYIYMYTYCDAVHIVYIYIYISNAQPALIRKNEEKVGRLMHAMCAANTVNLMHRALLRDAIIIVPHILPQESGKLIRFTSIGQSLPTSGLALSFPFLIYIMVNIFLTLLVYKDLIPIDLSFTDIR